MNTTHLMGVGNRYMSLSQEIRAMLLEAFIDGELTPGTRVNDLELANKLGVSRTPVREALHGLQSLGIIETLPARITRVARLSSEQYGHARTVWIRLYTLLLEEVLPKVEQSHVAQMLKFYNEASKATGDEFGTLTFRLFNTLVPLSESAFLRDSINAAAYRIRLGHENVAEFPQFTFAVREAQAKFVAAVADGRADRACEALSTIGSVPLPHELDATPGGTVKTPRISQWNMRDVGVTETAALAG